MAAPVRKRMRTDSSSGSGYKMAAVLDRDTGFSSWEEDLDTDMHSPTDASEDSVDVKVKPITSLMGCNKRKGVEPRKFGDEVKKRKTDFNSEAESESSPFRPWSHQRPSSYVLRGFTPLANRDQEEPLSLVLRDKPSHGELERLEPLVSPTSHATSRPRPEDVVRIWRPEDKVVPVKEELDGQYVGRVQEVEDFSDNPRAFSVESLMSDRPGTSSSTPSAAAGDKGKVAMMQSQQRNYKNMTRERRIEANARERTRVHTISAAFDTLRRAVPAYSHNQKLSKLSVLRIACSYILTLSRVAGSDYSADGSEPSLSDCVENVSRTIQLEGKLRKKKDE